MDVNQGIMYKKLNFNYKGHDFHIVPASGYPFCLSGFLFNFLYGLVLYFNGYGYYSFDGLMSITGLVLMVITIFCWLDDIVIESYQRQAHSDAVRRGLRMGMVLFIVSEVMFFFSFFWAYFHVALSPSMFIGCTWPPTGLTTFFSYGIPLVNTVLLVTSGAFLTASHYNLICGTLTSSLDSVLFRLYGSIMWGVVFLVFQLYEYLHLSFNINDSVYGSCFFMLTGFHGFHVFLGLCMLSTVTWYTADGVYNYKQHTGFECAAWYWHFVDVVWLFLFVFVYIWGGPVDIINGFFYDYSQELLISFYFNVMVPLGFDDF